MIEVRTLRARIVDLDHVEVTWSILPSPELLADYTFTLLASAAEHGPYDAVAGPFKDHYRVMDAGHPARMRPHVWYRLRVDGNGQTHVFPSAGGVSPLPKPDLVGLECARIERLRLQQSDGRLVTLLPVKSFGQLCSCTDPVTGRVLTSNCTLCYRTGYVGGFHNAVRVYVEILQPSSRALSDVIPITAGQAWLRTGNTPLLNVGDVIVENEDNRWRVANPIRTTERLRAVVRQEAPLDRVQASDPIYSHPVAFTMDEPAEERLYKRRMTI